MLNKRDKGFGNSTMYATVILEASHFRYKNLKHGTHEIDNVVLHLSGDQTTKFTPLKGLRIESKCDLCWVKDIDAKIVKDKMGFT